MMLKKILGMTFVFFIFAVFSLSVHATEDQNKIIVHCADNSDQYVVTLSFSPHIDLSGINVDINYDPNVLKPVRNKDNEVITKGEKVKAGLFVENPDFSPTAVRAVYVNTMPINDDSMFCQLTFQIVDREQLNENTISLTINEIFNSAQAPIPYAIEKTYGGQSSNTFSFNNTLFIIIGGCAVAVIAAAVVIVMLRRKKAKSKAIAGPVGHEAESAAPVPVEGAAATQVQAVPPCENDCSSPPETPVADDAALRQAQDEQQPADNTAVPKEPTPDTAPTEETAVPQSGEKPSSRLDKLKDYSDEI